MKPKKPCPPCLRLIVQLRPGTAEEAERRGPHFYRWLKEVDLDPQLRSYSRVTLTRLKSPNSTAIHPSAGGISKFIPM